eukprot:scaffold290426_cov19-Tisochrysis_lutea.AAC.1
MPDASSPHALAAALAATPIPLLHACSLLFKAKGWIKSTTGRRLQSLAHAGQQGNQDYFGRVRVAGLRGNQMLSGAFLHQ